MGEEHKSYERKSLYKVVSSFFYNLFFPFLKYKQVFHQSNTHRKGTVISGTIIMGSGQLLLGEIEKGLLFLGANIIYIYYFFIAGWQSLIGKYELSYLNLRLVFIIFTLLFVYLYLICFRDLVNSLEKRNKGEKSGQSIIIKNFKSFKTNSRKFREDFEISFYSGDLKARIAVLLAFVFMGIPHLIHKQIAKGLIFCGLQILYIVFMVTTGIACLKGFISLEVVGQRSDASILYGIVTIVITCLYLYMHWQSLKTALENNRQVSLDLPVKTFKQELSEITGKKFYRLALLMPVIGVLTFTIFPLIFMICIAFTNYGTSGVMPIMGIKSLSWIGFNSFKELFSFGAQFETLVRVFGWTIMWAVLATLSCYLGGLLLALLINKKAIKHKIIYRSLFVVAMAVPQFVTLRVMNAMFNKFGPINNLFGTNIEFWSNTSMARTLIILINMWIGIPYFMLLISGLLINIPQDYYDAAKVEGASKWVIFQRIIFPQIFFMTTPLLITSFISNINNFNVIWLLTQGGPSGLGGYTNGAGGTDILITWLFKLTMRAVPEYNIGAAIGIVMFIISATLSIVIFRNSASYKKEEEFQG